MCLCYWQTIYFDCTLLKPNSRCLWDHLKLITVIHTFAFLLFSHQLFPLKKRVMLKARVRCFPIWNSNMHTTNVGMSEKEFIHRQTSGGWDLFTSWFAFTSSINYFARIEKRTVNTLMKLLVMNLKYLPCPTLSDFDSNYSRNLSTGLLLIVWTSKF